MKYLNSDEVEALEDGELSVFLKLGDDLGRLLTLDSGEGIKIEIEIEEMSKNKTLETDFKTESKMRIQKLRDFKIYGTVGDPKQKDKCCLT